MTARLKSTSSIKSQVLNNHKCTVPGCNDDVTIYKGAGESLYCRYHQMMLIENGGLAKPNRPYTFWKKYTCQNPNCNYSPWEDKRFDEIEDPKIKHQAQRATLICDHIVKQELAEKLGWDFDKIHGPENIQTLCQICDKIKSAKSGDWHRVRDDELEQLND